MIFMHTPIHPETSKPQSFITMSTLTSSSQNQTFHQRNVGKPQTRIITLQYLSSRKTTIKSLTPYPYDIHSSEQTLPCHMHTKLAQLRANKSPFLQNYLHTVNPKTYLPQCPLCLSHTHTQH